jgi:EAL domain-containing protein (putative c-di-GMP-specific phosphodiesterase class I)
MDYISTVSGVEIRESSAMTALDPVARMLRSIKELGPRICLEDSGAGPSSLIWLRRFPIDRLKLSSTLVTSLPNDEEDAAMVGTIVGIARSLRLTVAAPGVETPLQLDFLRRAGCDFAQGSLLGPPRVARPSSQPAAARQHAGRLPAGQKTLILTA